jgi:large subunit ribosomal protein L9
MKVVLLETVGNLGVAGSVVNVRLGYARNFLFPRKKAVVADSRNLKFVAHQKMMVEHKLKKAKATAEESRKTIENLTVTLARKSAGNEKLFGSVTTIDIENALKELSIVVSRKAIHLAEPIKKVGSYRIPVKLEGSIEATINLEVTAEKA